MESLFKLESKLKRLLVTNKLLAIKAEFEAEGTRIDELASLSDICCKYNVPLTLKIGGPSAQRDVYEAFQLSATNIMVPMVESSFAVSTSSEIFEKYLRSFKGLRDSTNLLINVESVLTIKNFDSILETIIQNELSINSLVIGRTDLSASLGINDVNSKKIFELSKEIIEKSNKYSIPVAIGGNLTNDSFEFINRLAGIGLHAFESRKCTYKIENEISKKDFEELINIGLEFELAWLNYKKETYTNQSNQENTRIKTISYRLQS
tara:strand:+ start:1321 stop:2112 length:792 start_codon:yes stop_codon:yes gene_type:complete